MQITDIDSIVRSAILDRGYTLHWYLQFLLYAKDCFRELSLDDLKAVNSVILPVNQFTNTATLPDGYVDYVRVGVKYGQKVKPLAYSNKISRITNRDATFNPVKYNSNATDPQLSYGGIGAIAWGYTTMFNAYGESTGRAFGYGAGTETDTFNIFPERNEIQLNEDLYCTEIVLDYSSDGMDIDAASRVDVYAIQTIKSYIFCKLKDHNRNYSDSERLVAEKKFDKQRKILRARKSDLTIDVVRRIAQRNYKQTSKA